MCFNWGIFQWIWVVQNCLSKELIFNLPISQCHRWILAAMKMNPDVILGDLLKWYRSPFSWIYFFGMAVVFMNLRWTWCINPGAIKIVKVQHYNSFLFLYLTRRSMAFRYKVSVYIVYQFLLIVIEKIVSRKLRQLWTEMKKPCNGNFSSASSDYR